MTSIDTAAAGPFAAIELLDALSSVQGIFTEYHHETALLRLRRASTASSLCCRLCSLVRRWSSPLEGIFAMRFLPWLRSSLPGGCLIVCRQLYVARLRRHRRIRFLSDHAGYSGRRDFAGGETGTPRPCRTACLHAGPLQIGQRRSLHSHVVDLRLLGWSRANI